MTLLVVNCSSLSVMVRTRASTAFSGKYLKKYMVQIDVKIVWHPDFLVQSTHNILKW